MMARSNFLLTLIFITFSVASPATNHAPHNVYQAEIERADRNAVLGLAPTYQKHVRPPPTNKRLTCGTSLAEATSSGCLFDPLTVQWLPSQCSRELADDYSKQPQSMYDEQPFRYFADRNGKEEILDLSKKTDDAGYWTTQREHLTHCAYMLLRAAKMKHTAQRVDSMTALYQHSEHCAFALLNASRSDPTWDDIQTQGWVRFGSC
jgi:hypothetical protein